MHLSRQAQGLAAAVAAVVLVVAFALVSAADDDSPPADEPRASVEEPGGETTGAAAEVETTTTTSTTTAAPPASEPTTADDGAIAQPDAGPARTSPTVRPAARPRTTTTTTTTTTVAPRPTTTTTTTPRGPERFGPPPDAGIEHERVAPAGQPSLAVSAPHALWSNGCALGTARYEVRDGPDANGDGLPDRQVATGALERQEGSSGEQARYEGVVPPVGSAGEEGKVYVSFDCNGAAMEFWFDVAFHA